MGGGQNFPKILGKSTRPVPSTLAIKQSGMTWSFDSFWGLVKWDCENPPRFPNFSPDFPPQLLQFWENIDGKSDGKVGVISGLGKRLRKL